MVFHMKTTLIIPDPVFRDLKKRAVERKTTFSELATEYLRQGLQARPKPKRLPRLPSFKMGPPMIDITSRDEIYRVLVASQLSPSTHH
jgi:predicted CopG family antitoxin